MQVFRPVLTGFLLVLALLDPALLWAQGSPNARTAALAYLDDNAAALGLERGATDRVVTNEYRSTRSGITHIYLKQQLDGIEVANGTLNVNVAADGRVLSVGNRFVPDLAPRMRARTSQTQLDAATAVKRAATGLGLDDPGTLVEIDVRTGPAQATRFAGTGLSRDEIPVKLAYYALPSGDVRLTWEMNIAELDQPHWWHLWIDAETGAIVAQVDWIAHDTYEVFEIPKESPSDGPQTIQTNPADAVASPFGWHDTDGVLGAEHTVTRGNNVCAQEDRNADDAACGGGAQPDGGATLDFQFPFDPNDQPFEYLDTAIANLFYWNNVMHDVLYRHGFDEAAGNFQENNYGNGGAGNDSVNADAQDGSGLNNANFGTPPDGSRPRMQMFEWVATNAREVVIDAPSSAAGTYGGSRALFGPPLSGTGVSGSIILADDTVAPITDGCSSFAAGFFTNALALIDRGDCTFATKVRNAQNAGALGAVIVNNDPNGTVTMADDGTGGDITIPSTMISLADGNLIKAGLPATGTARLDPSAPPSRDSDLDAGIIAHEYCHGLSNRLTGGPSTASCLTGNQQAGEGWSDFCALFVTAAATDTATTPRGIGTYVVFQAPTGGGIRPFPYSTDIAVNPLTYGDLTTAGLAGGLSIPHGVGTVWATALWDMYWKLVDAHGFDADLHTGTGGNNLAMQLVIDGLKLQPCSPTFLEARDAILLADANNNASANECLIWEAFAKRGMGASAADGGSSTTLSVTEAFDLPAQCLTGCGDGTCDTIGGEDCTTCAADCDDTDACTTCVTGALVGCNACETCDAIAGCIVNPAPTCRQPTEPLKAKLLIRDRLPDSRDQLIWRWLKGEATNIPDFGDPLATDAYTLCVYDRSGPTTTLAFGAVAPPGELCGSKPCWKSKNGRLTYRDKERTPDGIDRIVPRANVDGKAKITIKGRGENLSLPSLPLPLPALVQLQVGNGECWEAEFFQDGVKQNNGSQFNGRAGQP